MVEQQIILDKNVALMGRAAANFIQKSKRFSSDIYLEKDHKIYNGKSIMSILSMGAGKGTTFILRVDGPDEDATLESLLEYLDHEMPEH